MESYIIDTNNSCFNIYLFLKRSSYKDLSLFIIVRTVVAVFYFNSIITECIFSQYMLATYFPSCQSYQSIGSEISI